MIRYTKGRWCCWLPSYEKERVMAEPFLPLTALTEAQRTQALERFTIIRPALEEGVSRAQVARTSQIAPSTVQLWIKRYREKGLAGLANNVARSDKGKSRKLPETAIQLIEGLALQKPPRSMAAIHRHANAMWQADHTPLDVLLLDETGTPAKPWLTAIEDDYSRMIVGYRLSFQESTALTTALALRQAIWRKEAPHWHASGLPTVFYTDHGSDFTSKHMEQVAADLPIELIFSQVGIPRGRGKIERFYLRFCPIGSSSPGLSNGVLYAPGFCFSRAHRTRGDDLIRCLFVSG